MSISPHEQIRADIKIRPFDERDYDALVTVSNAIFPDRVTTVDEQRYEDGLFDRTKYAWERYVAIDRDTGVLAGYAGLWHIPWNFHPRKFGITIRVQPQRWGRGIGAHLWDRLVHALQLRDALAGRAVVREDLPQALRFVQTRGFAEVMRTWESHLNVAACDLSQFAGDVERAAAAGVTVVTLGDEMAKDPACLRRQYALDMELTADVPSPDPFTPVEFETWRQHGVASPWFIPDAYFIAVCDGQYVGTSTLWKPKVGDWLQQGLTGVKREYRGRGIAQALKVGTVEYARAHGCAQIRTENEIHNARMIAINDRLGFVRQPAWIVYSKEF